MVRYHGNKPPSLFGLSLVFPQQGSGRPMELGLLHPRIMMCTTCIRTSVPSEVSFLCETDGPSEDPSKSWRTREA